jgi:Zn-dependent M28 family amino/carboxypeptidase
MRRRAAASLIAAAVIAAGCGREAERRSGGGRPAAGVAADAGKGAAATTGDLWFPDVSVLGERVRVLADPALRGRGGGTADEAAAADKIAAWFRAAGLEPGGDGGYLQPFTRTDGKPSQNVIGVLAAADPKAGHVVIGAHYDHLGVLGGDIHPGADDNASGVVGLVAIAEALARAGQRPAVTVVVVAFGSEEDGLLGSAAYVADPTLPLAQARLMVNLDMIGRAAFLTGKDHEMARAYVAADAIGALASPRAFDLVAAVKNAGKPEGRPVVAASDFGPFEDAIRSQVELRGDHASFSRAGVRYLWLSTSMHDDYHQPTDTPDKIDPATIAVVGRIVVRVVRGLPAKR